jgi:hypothetical protein
MKTDLLIITIAVNDGSNFAGGRVDRLYLKPTSYVSTTYKNRQKRTQSDSLIMTIMKRRKKQKTSKQTSRKKQRKKPL